MECDKNMCPVVDVDGVIQAGKQFDLDIILPEDNRNVIFGVVKDCFKEPVCNAVVKLIEVSFEHGKEERKPVSHTFTDKEGEFVFGPLCPDRFYELQIWVNRVEHVKVCSKSHCKHDECCLKGVDKDHCDCFICDEIEHCNDHDHDHDCDCHE